MKAYKPLCIVMALAFLLVSLPVTAFARDTPLKVESSEATGAAQSQPESLPPQNPPPQSSQLSQPMQPEESETESSQPEDPKDTPKSNMVITSYRVYTHNQSRELRSITKGSRVDIEILIKNTEVITSALGSSGLSVTKPIDSFRFDGTPEVAVLSGSSEPLMFRLRFSGMVYSGEGKELRFVVSYPNLSLPYDAGEIKVYECVEYTKKENSERDEDAEKAKEAENAAVPIIQIIRGTLLENIGAEQEFKLPLTIKNLSGTEDIENLVLNFSASEALMIMDASPSKVIRSLKEGKSTDITLSMKTTKEIPAAAQFVTVEMKYDYLPAGSGIRKNSTATEKILIPLIPTGEKKKLLSATPNLIISQYDFGGEPVPVGAVFDLKLAFQNTSQKLPVENIVMKLETGEAFSITASSNAFFFPILGAGGKQEQGIPVQALASGKAETNKITVTFNYEFVDQDTREKVTASETLAIPIFQPDRFEITPPQLPETVTAGQEAVLSFPYVNKGRGELYNMEASLEGNANILNAHQNLGNFEAGKSGTIDFVVTPQEAGEITLTAKILYEDVNMKPKELNIPVKLTVGEPILEQNMDSDMEWMETEQPAPNKWLLWVLIGAIAVPVILVVLIRKLKKRRLRKASQNAAQKDSEAADGEELSWMEGEDSNAEK